MNHLESLSDWLQAPSHAREHGVQYCLNRIRDLEPSIEAWVHIEPQAPTGSGALSGIPFGVKDIYETEGLPTEYGSSIYKGRLSAADSWLVRELRQRGGIMLGKTQTTAFAYRTPAPTRNPRAREHTPGGSSSGSAAGVAAGMVPFALGTQTLGSVLRPASFCGVTGFKPSYGLLSTEGVLPFARSLDTLGFFTHTATDMLMLWQSLDRQVGPAEDLTFGVPDPVPDVEPPMAAAFRRAIESLRKAGLPLHTLDISGMLSALASAASAVMFYEGARFHQKRFEDHGEGVGPDLATVVREGLQISNGKYDDARRCIAESKARMVEAFKRTPVILVPAAMGPAPLGLTSTGDPRMNSPWTALGTPAISIPMPVGNALPLGLQLTTEHGSDARLLRAATVVQGMLGAS